MIISDTCFAEQIKYVQLQIKRNVSPLRYPGGKRSFVPFLASAINANNLQGCHFFEPYAGGAGEEIKGEIDFETSGGAVVVAMGGKGGRIVFGHGLEGGVFDDDALDGSVLEDVDTLLEALLEKFLKHCEKECDGVMTQSLVK